MRMRVNFPTATLQQERAIRLDDESRERDKRVGVGRQRALEMSGSGGRSIIAFTSTLAHAHTGVKRLPLTSSTNTRYVSLSQDPANLETK